jgi:hypothetical protein
MDADLHSIIADLNAPGRILVFCDETDLTVNKRPRVAPPPLGRSIA